MDRWISLGVDETAAEIAYDRTVLKTGKLAWSYMDSIMNNWHGRGLHTEYEILAKDGKPGNGGSESRNLTNSDRKYGTPDNAELARMRKILDRIQFLSQLSNSAEFFDYF